MNLNYEPALRVAGICSTLRLSKKAVGVRLQGEKLASPEGGLGLAPNP